MKSLNKYIQESLLGGFEEIEASMDPKKEIGQFIKDNYKTRGRLQISDEPNENGKYEVNCSKVEVRNKEITSLTNNLFEWGEISGSFDCINCSSLTSLEGAPKEVGGAFNCSECRSLISLKGTPDEVGGSFSCSECRSLTSLEGAPEKVGWNFDCSECRSLTSLEGAPKEVSGNFNCSHCHSLKILKGAPKKVGGDFWCLGCKQDFTEDDVRKICGVKEFVYTK